MRTVVLVMATILLSVTACSSSKDLAAAEAEAKSFHETFNVGQFESLYDNGADELKKSGSRQEFLELLGAIRRKLGKNVDSKRAGWRVNFATGGTSVVIDYETAFETGKATEEFVYRMVSGKPLLAACHISSKELLLR